VSVDILADKVLEHIVAHPEVAPACGVEILFLEVIAVRAVEIANWAVRFGHDMKWLHNELIS
jgi:hypothetical protein